MSDQAWAALAGVVAFLLLQLATGCFFLGGMASEVRRLKVDVAASHSQPLLIAGLQATIAALNDRMASLERALDQWVDARQRRRRAAGEGS